MRVSSYSKFELTQYHMNEIQSKTVKQQYQIATGRFYQHASEDPIRANQVGIIKQSLEKIAQYQRNIEDAEGFLKTSESTIGSVSNVLQTIREEGLKSANGTYSQSDKDTFSLTINSMIDQLLTVANTKYLGKYLFSGEKTDTPAYTYNGLVASFQGDLNAPVMKISPNMNVKVSDNGQRIFQDAFDAVIELRDQVKTGTVTDIEAAIGKLDLAANSIINIRSEMGIKLRSVENMKNAYETEQLGLDVKRSNIEEVDATKLMMEYATTQQINQATIASMQKMFSVSLLDYI